MAAQSLLPDSFASRVRLVLEDPSAGQLIQRLWAKDASLWTSDPTAQAHIRQRLGWLSVVHAMEPQIEQILTEVQAIRQEGLSHALLLGMGGSSLFPEVCRFTLKVAAQWLDLALLDTTDPVAIAAAQQRAPLDRTLIIVSSKSGTTTETSALGDYFYDQLRRLRGDRAGRQCLAITDAGTPLEAQAKQREFRRIFVHGPTTGQDVGGRFSGLTYFGLVPAALIGVQIARVLASAKAMLAACQPSGSVADNPAVQLAICLTEAAAQGRDKVTLLCAQPLARFSAWAEQLLAESTGKDGKGLIPIDGEPLRDPAAYLPDRLFVELQLASELDRNLARKVEALAAVGHPVVRLYWQDRYDLGAEAIRWFAATALAASRMQINAFDEPNVQESKDRTKALLERYAREGRLPTDEPLMTEGGISVYGERTMLGGQSAKDALRALLQQINAGDYLAVLSFLPRTSALDAAVGILRNELVRRQNNAIMLGYGPRYLHSTGQLHKGGPDRVVFLMLTAEDPMDLPVPGKPYSFSVLKAAQALGDFQALKERKRRIVRLHLGRAPEEGMQRLLEVLKTR
jgi:glucose-6-phosphate isomerase